MSKILVLGGNGFVGSHLVDSLVSQGHEVTCLSREKDPANLSHLEGKIAVVRGDFTDVPLMDDLTEGKDYVFNLISYSTPASRLEDHIADMQENVPATLRLLELCVKHNIKKLIYTSSGGAIYGNQPDALYSENTLAKPVSYYGASKLHMESVLSAFRNSTGLDYLVFRISNPYGPRQNPEGKQGLIAVSLGLIKSGKPITVFGDGTNVRDYIYVTDVAEMMAKTFDQDTRESIYNLGSGQGFSINDILNIYRTELGLDFETKHEPGRPTDVIRVVLDMKRFSEEFKINPEIDFVDGIKSTWEHINK
jgi:UDP-glucose 4-epimerase